MSIRVDSGQWSRLIGWGVHFLIAMLAIQWVAQEAAAAFLCLHPRPLDQRRVVAHVLPVAAGQNGPPIPLLILLKADDDLLHG